MKKSAIFLLLLLSGFTLANVSLPYFFSDNMVLQRDSAIPVWGFADAGETVEIKFKNQSKKTVADQSGNWKIELNPEKFGGPFEMTIAGKNTIVLKNILIGDVWLCSGQSNMEWKLADSDGYKTELQQKKFPLVRHLKIKKDVNTFPQNNIQPAEWQSANAQTVGEFSGVAYFFAKKMYQETGIPVGLINSTWGGTNIETWISREGFEGSAHFREMISRMPKLPINDLLKVSQTQKQAFFESKLNSKIDDFSSVEFLKNDFDDSRNATIIQPQNWEAQGFEGLDGTVWFRKKLILKKEQINGKATLYLSKIDDEDETYFNGVLVGATKSWDKERVYEIPQNLMKLGENVIVIKVTDTGGGGGIYGENQDLKLQTSAKEISLAGRWKIAIKSIQKTLDQNDYPTIAYNAMIAPLIPMKLKGILWYQGESNASRAQEYKISFPLLINSWREKFGENLPFYFVQLSTFETAGKNSNEGSSWAELREAQIHTLRLKNTAMAVTTDVGNPNDIHPRNKKTVGERLANLALGNGKVSPVLAGHKISGNKVTITFSPGKKLKTSDNSSTVGGLEAAGKDGIFYPATGVIKGKKLIVSSPQVKDPVAVRMGWKGNASENNLFTVDNLPVSPFRTDDFPLITKDQTYQLNLK